MTDEEIQERKKLFAESKAELFKRQLANADTLDKSILTYSSAGLGLSLAFLKDFIPIADAAAPWLLYMSWALFVGSTVATLASFFSSQLGIRKQLALNERYYLKLDDTAVGERNRFAELTEGLSYLSGAVFVVALVCTTIFVYLNLERAAFMKDQKIPVGAPVPGIQEVPGGTEDRGAPVPGIQRIPGSTQPSKPSPGTDSPPSGGGSGTGGAGQAKP